MVCVGTWIHVGEYRKPCPLNQVGVVESVHTQGRVKLRCSWGGWKGCIRELSQLWIGEQVLECLLAS